MISLKTPANPRVAITMRVVQAPNYVEPRDALAWDWATRLEQLVPNATLLPLPNVGDATQRWLDDVQPHICVISGGNDIGEEARRDQTEEALLQWCIRTHTPVLGVCRGLQLINGYFGGTLQSVSADIHVARRHRILRRSDPASGLPDDGEVNSFHNFGIGNPGRDLDVLYRSEDGAIEAMMHSMYPILGIMWHPEREMTVSALTKSLVSLLFDRADRCQTGERATTS